MSSLQKLPLLRGTHRLTLFTTFHINYTLLLIKLATLSIYHIQPSSSSSLLLSTILLNTLPYISYPLSLYHPSYPYILKNTHTQRISNFFLNTFGKQNYI